MYADLQASTIGIISLGGRIPQIVMNVRNGHSGQLSAITCGMNTAGCFARMFTTLVLTQVGDRTLSAAYPDRAGMSLLAASSLACQV